MQKRLRGSSVQREFLRKLRNDPMGLPAESWPGAHVLRRWMRQPGFVAAMNSIHSAIGVRMELHLSAAAQSAAMALHQSLIPKDRREGEDQNALAVIGEQRMLIHSLIQLLRLVRGRNRSALQLAPMVSNELNAWRGEKAKATRKMVERREVRVMEERSATARAIKREERKRLREMRKLELQEVAGRPSEQALTALAVEENVSCV